MLTDKQQRWIWEFIGQVIWLSLLVIFVRARHPYGGVSPFIAVPVLAAIYVSFRLWMQSKRDRKDAP
jgi:hypothetical protein